MSEAYPLLHSQNLSMPLLCPQNSHSTTSCSSYLRLESNKHLSNACRLLSFSTNLVVVVHCHYNWWYGIAMTGFFSPPPSHTKIRIRGLVWPPTQARGSRSRVEWHDGWENGGWLWAGVDLRSRELAVSRMPEEIDLYCCNVLGCAFFPLFEAHSEQRHELKYHETAFMSKSWSWGSIDIHYSSLSLLLLHNFKSSRLWINRFSKYRSYRKMFVRRFFRESTLSL